MIKLLHGDCLERLTEIPDGSVHMVLTDPPYSSGGLFAGDRKRDTRVKYIGNEFNGAARFRSFSGDNMDQRSFTEFLRMVLFKCRQKTVPGGICGVFIDWRNLPAVTDALQAAGWVWRGIVVWNKGVSRPVLGRYRNDCEFFPWATNGPREAAPVDSCSILPGFYNVPSVTTGRRHHQTEKPVPLLERLIELCPAGSTVLDPFMGSGSTGVACAKTGRDFVGIELDVGYYDTARLRIEGVENAAGGGTAQMSLFAPPDKPGEAEN